MDWLFSWEVSSVVVALLISIALAVLALNDFKVAKACFLVSALWAAVSVFMWAGHNAWETAKQTGVGGVALFIIFILLVVAFRYTDRKEEAKKRETQIFSEEFAKRIIDQLRKVEAQAEETLQNAEEEVPLGEGFVQFEERSIAIENQTDVPRIAQGDLRVGEIIKVKFGSANRGPRPVFDYQSWGAVVCVDPAKNPGKQLRNVMLQGLKVGYEQFKKSGNDLGAGKETFNFAQSTPLTAEELEGLKSGTLRVHVLLGGAWSNPKGHRFYWTNAEWTNWPHVPITASWWKGA